MKTSVRKSFVVVPLYLLLVLILSGGIPSGVLAADTVKIGYLEVKSGPLEFIGRFFQAGFEFAVHQQNEKGGLLGKKIEFILEDSEFKPDVANRKGKRLIMQDKVDILASGGGSHIAVVMNKLATSYKKLYINHAGMTDHIQGKEFSPYGFRVVPNMYAPYAGLAMFMAKKPYRRFYLINPDYLSGYSCAKVFKEQLKVHVPDAEIVGEDYHPMSTKDFAPYITKIIAAKADAVLLGSFGPDLINMIKQSRAMGLKAPFPFLSHVSEPYPMMELKDDGVGIHIVQQYSLRVNTPENQEMIKKFHEMHKNDKDFLTWWPVGGMAGAALGWMMTFAAIEKAGTLDPQKVIETYEGFQYESPVGTYTMRACDHQALIPMYGFAIKAGPNPFFDGSIRSDVKFPWDGPELEKFPAEKVAIPATPDYNPRCK